MSIPASYDATSLAEFVLTTLGDVATELGWDEDSLAVDEILTETLILYGEDALDDCTDVPRLRALTRVAAWRAAVVGLAGAYTMSLGADGGSYSRSDLQAQARRALSYAEASAGPYLAAGSGNVVSVSPILRTRDPYA